MEDKDSVMLSVSQCECDYIMSEATGKSNFAIGPEYLNRYTSNKSAAAMLNEREQQIG